MNTNSLKNLTYRLPKGHIPWNKGTKGIMKSNQTSFTKGRKDFLHPVWKGEFASYSAIHHWVKRWKGRPNKCENCGFIGKCTWANLDHSYKRILEDYISLCRKCHYAFDVNFNGRKVLVHYTRRYVNKNKN